MSTHGVKAELHVSPNGDDRNPGTAAAPFRTVGRAREAVRGINGRMTGDIVVVAASAEVSRQAVKRVFEVGPAFVRAEAGVLTGRGGRADLRAPVPPRIAGSSYVPAGRVFVIGDNFPVSLDSREYGPVPIEKIIGKVLLYSGGRIRAGIKTESSKDAADDVDR